MITFAPEGSWQRKIGVLGLFIDAAIDIYNVLFKRRCRLCGSYMRHESYVAGLLCWPIADYYFCKCGYCEDDEGIYTAEMIKFTDNSWRAYRIWETAEPGKRFAVKKKVDWPIGIWSRHSRTGITIKLKNELKLQ
jgi:hypothetical protein